MSDFTTSALEPRLLINKTWELLVDAVIVVDPHSHLVLACNPSFTRTFGYQPAEVLGRDTGLLHVDAQSHLEFRRRLRAALEASRRFEGQYPLRRKDGEIFASEHSVSGIRDDSGRLVGVLGVVRDISQRLAAEETLRQNEELYRQVFDTNTAVKLIVDPQDGSIVHANRAAVVFYGYPARELTAKTIFDLNPFDPPATRGRMDQHVQGHNLVFNTRHRLASGAVRDVEIFTGPVILAGRQLLYGIVHDISPRKKAERELQQLNEKLEQQVRERTASLADTVAQLRREIAQHQQARQDLEASAQRFRTLLEHTLQGVAILQGNPTHFAYVNQRMTEIFGYSAEEFSALGPEEMWRLVHPEDRDLVRQRALTRLEGQVVQPRYEFRILRKDGGVRWVEVFSALTEHCGRPASQIAYIDITERKRAEEALLASEEKFSVAFRHAPVMAAITVLEDGTYLEVNDKFMEASGFKREEVLGRTSVEVGWLKPEDRQRVLQTLQAQGRVAGMEITSYTKDGQALDCLYNCELVNIGGVRRLLTLVMDISERKRAEETLMQLAAGVAHNFNNVLMATISNAQAAQGLLKDPLTHVNLLENLLDNVVQAARGGRDVVQRLSQVVGFQKQGLDMTQAVDAGLLLRSLPATVEGMRLGGGQGRIGVHLDLGPGLFVSAAAGGLMEVFLNLAKNAADAMPRGGVINIAGRVEAGQVVIDFSDSGMGADPATLSRFFDPFFSTKGSQGQGLGLAVSHSIVASHGGELTARSQPGQGTTLTIRLPLSPEPPAARGQAATPAPPQPLRVLLVEDEGLVAMGLSFNLESAGYQVRHVGTLTAALEALVSFRPDLAICDLGLPDHQGAEVSWRLKQAAREKGLEDMPIVVLSGWDQDQVEKTSNQALTAFAYLQKPVGRDRLLEVISLAAGACGRLQG